MASILDLNEGALSGGSQIPFYDPNNGASRRASLTALADAVEGLIGADGKPVAQYASPNATGFGVQITPAVDGGDVWLLLTPAAGYAAGTITLPAAATCEDGQEVTVSCTQAVTTLTVAGNGSTVNNAPTTLAAGAFFGLRFDGVQRAWYRNR